MTYVLEVQSQNGGTLGTLEYCTLDELLEEWPYAEMAHASEPEQYVAWIGGRR
jgi:hypothetical protein